MPRDLPTRCVFLSRSHFVSFIPLSTTTCGLRPRSGRSGDALPRCFSFMLGSTTVFMSHSFRWRVGHPARACLAPFVVRVETLAFIRNKNNNYKSAVILFFANQSAVILYHVVSLLLDIGKNTSVRQHMGRRPSWSTCHARRTPRESHPSHRAAVTMTNEPSNHRPTSHFEVALTTEPSWLH